MDQILYWVSPAPTHSAPERSKPGCKWQAHSLGWVGGRLLMIRGWGWGRKKKSDLRLALQTPSSPQHGWGGERSHLCVRMRACTCLRACAPARTCPLRVRCNGPPHWCSSSRPGLPPGAFLASQPTLLAPSGACLCWPRTNGGRFTPARLNEGSGDFCGCWTPNPRAPSVEVSASGVGVLVELRPRTPPLSFSAAHGLLSLFFLVSALAE